MKRAASIITITLLLMGANTGFSQPGTLDINFNGSGKVLMDMGTDEFASTMVIQNDQKIVVAGFHGSGSVVDFAVTRFNPDGSLDNSFGTNGTTTTDFASSVDVPNDMIIQDDGKIVVSGFSNAGSTITMAIARYNADGTLDPGFGVGGAVATSGSYGSAVGNGIHAQPDGKLLLCGYYNNGVDNDLLIARLNTDGTLDNSFSYDGFASYDVSGLNDVGSVVRYQSDGKILVAGYSQDPSSTDKYMTLVRFESDGMIDLDFGINGLVQTNFGSNNVKWNDMRILSNDKMILTGYAEIWGTTNMAIAKLNADGTLDTEFEGSGNFNYSFAPLENSEASSQTITPDVRIVVAGSSGDLTGADFAVAMFGSDGIADADFGVNGGVKTDFAANYDRAYQVAMQDDGLLVVAGAAIVSDFDIAVARYTSGINIGIGEVETYIGSTLIYPNPILNRTATLNYSLANAGDISVHLFGADGKFISSLIEQEFRAAGQNTESLIIPEVASGPYLLRIGTAEGQVSVTLNIR